MRPAQTPENLRRYWRRTLLITGGLLFAWFLVTFVVAAFARELSFDFFGWPFAYWMGAQGAPIIYVLIIGAYAWAMNRLDREFGVDEGDEE